MQYKERGEEEGDKIGKLCQNGRNTFLLGHRLQVSRSQSSKSAEPDRTENIFLSYKPNGKTLHELETVKVQQKLEE